MSDRELVGSLSRSQAQELVRFWAPDYWLAPGFTDRPVVSVSAGHSWPDECHINFLTVNVVSDADDGRPRWRVDDTPDRISR